MEKKLRKSKDKKICGVCGGLAEYFECDPTLVRLGAVVLCIGFGIGLLAYIVGAIIMPNAE